MTEKEKAIQLFDSVRGKYIVSQALCLAIKSIKEREPELQEPSNMADMELLLNLFPIYKVLEATIEQLQVKTNFAGEFIPRWLGDFPGNPAMRRPGDK
jgi:hypothetical protein